MMKVFSSIEASRGNAIGEKISDIYTGTLSENTKRAYTRDIKDFFQVHELSEITIEQLRAVDVSTANQFRERLRAEGKAVSTINRKLTSMSSFYRILSRREINLVEYNPFDTNEGNKRLVHNKKYSNTRSLTAEEVQKVVAVSSEFESPLLAFRNRIIVLLLGTTGMRREEIVGIQLKNFKINMGKSVVEITGKGDKERFIVVSDTIMVLIQNYLELRGMKLFDKAFADAYLLVSHSYNAEGGKLNSQTVYNVIKAVATKANVGAETISPHSFRHTFATLSRQEGVNLNDISDMMGHSDVATTKRYEHSDRVVNNHPAEELTKLFT